MAEISYRRHRFPPVIIQHAVWLYLRFTLSYRDVEELLAERGLDISYEAVHRCWVLKFGPDGPSTAASTFPPAPNVTAFRNEERERFCYFPGEPLAHDKWVFFVRAADAGRLKFSSFDDLVGHDIAVLRGASISPEFWNFVHEHRNFTETASDEANFRMLQAGRVDYVVASFVNGMRLIGSLGLDGKVQPLSSRSLAEDDMYVIFSRQRVAPAFVAAFSDALHQFKQTEPFRAVYGKYFPGPSYEPTR